MQFDCRIRVQWSEKTEDQRNRRQAGDQEQKLAWLANTTSSTEYSDVDVALARGSESSSEVRLDHRSSGEHF